MAPWSQIARPFSFYFAVNCFKTVLGAGLVGYGVALAVVEDTDQSNETHDRPEPESISQEDDDPSTRLIRKYIKIAATIGFGLFLSLPSLTSQIVWETMIPGITATDIAYDVGTENVRGILPKWDDIIKKPKLPGLNGLIRGKEGLETIRGVEPTTNRGSE